MALNVEMKKYFPWTRQSISLNTVFNRAHDGAVTDFLGSRIDDKKLHSWYGDIQVIKLITGSQTKTDAIINNPTLNFEEIVPPQTQTARHRKSS